VRSIENIIYRGNTVIYTDIFQGKTVLCKALPDGNPPQREIDALVNEYTIVSLLEREGIRRSIRKEEKDGLPVLILEYIEGCSLKHQLHTQELSTEEKLKTALRLAQILEGLHQQNLIHNDLTSENILLRRPDHSLFLIDFGSAFFFDVPTQKGSKRELKSSSLPYMAPEQTGRVNRPVDHRSDLYSFGIILYELFTGNPPFQSEDPQKLVYSHIAKQPASPGSLNSAVPLVLSSIILKLLAKNPENRYQRASGVKADLDECLQQYDKNRVIVPFPIARYDHLGILRIPETLYGREKELKAMVEALPRVEEGGSELILISGYPGIGKTALVREFEKLLKGRRGILIQGKAEQYRENIPYIAIMRAFNGFVARILSKPEGEFAAWQQSIAEAVGDSGKVITDVIPGFESIIGKQKDILPLGGQEAQNRFNFIFQNLIRCIAEKECPFVLFIDDLQWIDRASINVVKMLSRDEKMAGLLLIGAYRDNEVTNTHPLKLALKEIEAEVTLTTISLENLEKESISALLTDALNRSEGIGELSELFYSRARGNPFFTCRLLLSLKEEGRIFYDSGAGKWTWDVESLKSVRVSDNVIDMLITNIGSLKEETQQVLRVAACIGDRFSRSMLSILSHYSEDRIDCALEEALIKQYIYLEEQIYYFVHDRIRQAVHTLMDDRQRKATHLQLGRLLIKVIGEDTFADTLFEIINHLNEGAPLVESQEERDEIARLNLEAGKKARERAAYAEMLVYVRRGISLLGKNSWRSNYGLTKELFLALLEAEYLNTHFDRVDECAGSALKQIRGIPDKIRVHETLMLSNFARYRIGESLETGFRALELLGVTLKESLQVDLNPDELARLPTLKDRIKLAALKILMLMFPPAMISDKMLVWKVILTMIDLSIREGNSPFAAMAYAVYGMFLCSDTSTIELGSRFGGVALKLLERFPREDIQCRVREMYSFIVPWKKHVRMLIPFFQELIKSAQERGDIEVVCNTRMSICIVLYFIGEPLDFVCKEQQEHIEHIKTLKQYFQLTLALAWNRLVLRLLGKANEQEQSKDLYGDRTGAQVSIASGYALTSFYVNLSEMIYYYLMGDYEKALMHGEITDGYAESMYGYPIVSLHTLYYPLVLLKLISSATEEKKEAYLKKVESLLRKMKGWANHAPENFRNKYCLIEAEKARIGGKFQNALRFYEKAIQGAKENSLLHEEALSCERAGEYCLEHNLVELARHYLREAYSHYSQWGAVVKAKDLKSRYRELIEKHPISSQSGFVGELSPGSLDLQSVLKASHTLSSETELESLLNKMMGIVMENAGAERGFLLLKQGKRWFIEALGDFQARRYEVLLKQPYSIGDIKGHGSSIPGSAINLCMHSKQMVVSDNAVVDARFSEDEYVKSSGVKSILCIPLAYQNKLNGVLYLENRLSSNVFDNLKVETLELLCTQFSISLENALLYRSLDERLLFEKLLAEFSAAFVNLPSGEIDREIAHWLKELVLFFCVDRGSIYEFEEKDGMLYLSHFFAAPGIPRPSIALQFTSWFMEKMLGGQIILHPDQDESEEVFDEKAHFFEIQEVCSYIAMPMFAGGVFLGLITFSSFHSAQSWSSELLHRLHLLEEVFANAIVRKRNEQELQKRTAELRETAEKLRSLSEHLQEIREHERASIAREIHDELGQALTVMRMDASWIGKHTGEAPEKLRGRVDEIVGLIDATIRTVQRISTELRPEILDILGLTAAIEWQVEEFQRREGIPCRLSCDGQEVDDEKCRTVLFRVLQEALTNVSRHAKAREVRIRLSVNGEEAILEIRDNGRGITQQEAGSKNSLGLIGMRERVASLNGTLEITGKSRGGTCLRVNIPMRGKTYDKTARS
jgi:predicted ATPase/signal transduction histidine kinase